MRKEIRFDVKVEPIERCSYHRYLELVEEHITRINADAVRSYFFLFQLVSSFLLRHFYILCWEISIRVHYERRERLSLEK